MAELAARLADCFHAFPPPSSTGEAAVATGGGNTSSTSGGDDGVDAEGTGQKAGKLARPGLVTVVDVRSPEELARDGRLQDYPFVNVPLSALLAAPDNPDAVVPSPLSSTRAGLPPSGAAAPVVVFCSAGSRSATAKRLLEDKFKYSSVIDAGTLYTVQAAVDQAARGTGEGRVAAGNCAAAGGAGGAKRAKGRQAQVGRQGRQGRAGQAGERIEAGVATALLSAPCLFACSRSMPLLLVPSAAQGTAMQVDAADGSADPDLAAPAAEQGRCGSVPSPFPSLPCARRRVGLPLRPLPDAAGFVACAKPRVLGHAARAREIGRAHV